jgi:hypothetical protein
MHQAEALVLPDALAQAAYVLARQTLFSACEQNLRFVVALEVEEYQAGRRCGPDRRRFERLEK